MKTPARAFNLKARDWVFITPFAWLMLFFLVPFLLIFKVSISEATVSVPPYGDLLHFVDGILTINIDFSNYFFIFKDAIYLGSFLSSLKIAFFSTIGCLLIGYPMAYGIARADTSVRNLLLMMVVLPSWTSFLLRIYAWIGILKNEGFLNQILMTVGLISDPIKILHTDAAIYIGIIYAYLPFMILPLYANLVKLDDTLLEAAADLGARPFKAFWTITVPLSKSGIIAGSMLVFIPAVGEFVIPDLLGGSETLMIGKTLWQEFFSNRDWPLASAVAVVTLACLIVPIALFARHEKAELQQALE